MASLNDHIAWAGNIDDVVALPIDESSKPLVDLTRDNGEAGPSSTVPPDERTDPRKHFFEHYDRFGPRRR
jgi:hypothetical protein